MTAQATNVPFAHGGSGVEAWHEVDASIHIYVGEPVCKNLATGGIAKAANAASMWFMGFAENEYDNSAVASLTTNRVLRVLSGIIREVAVTGAAITDEGKPLFLAADSGSFEVTNTAGTGTAGIITKFISATLVEAYFPPFGYGLVVGS